MEDLSKLIQHCEDIVEYANELSQAKKELDKVSFLFRDLFENSQLYLKLRKIYNIVELIYIDEDTITLKLNNRTYDVTYDVSQAQVNDLINIIEVEVSNEINSKP